MRIAIFTMVLAMTSQLVWSQGKTEEKESQGIKMKYEYRQISANKRNVDYYMIFSGTNTNDTDLYFPGAPFPLDMNVPDQTALASINIVNGRASRTRSGSFMVPISDYVTKDDRPLYRLEAGKTFELEFEFRVKVSEAPPFVRFGLKQIQLKPLDEFELFSIEPPFPDAKFPTTTFDRYGRALPVGSSLTTNDCLSSKNQNYYLVMQEDGNLCVYQRGANGKDNFVWGTMTNGSGANDLRMQDDGNLMLYNSYNQPVWSSQTTSMFHPQFSQAANQPKVLFLEDDGILGLYTEQGEVVWKSDSGIVEVVTEQEGGTGDGSGSNYADGGTSAEYVPPTELNAYNSLHTNEYMYSENGRYYAIMQEDGNLCVYKVRDYGGDLATWCTKTNFSSASELRMQGDGNLVLYNNNNKPIWKSGTTKGEVEKWGAKRKPNKLVLRNDGKLALYDDYGNVVWTHTRGGTRL